LGKKRSADARPFKSARFPEPGGKDGAEGGMLVLSRKRSEQILIGSTIRITVVKLDGHQVRLGIEAPAVLPVIRGELLRRPRRRPDAGGSDGMPESPDRRGDA
jgi:carbon storage regulator